MIRPELRAAAHRWREVAITGAGAALGLYWLFLGTGIMRWVGGAVLIVALVCLREGIARLKRPRGGGGPGVVELDERRITYFGPDGGGAISLDALTFVAVERRPGAPPVWLIADGDGAHVAIPGNAEGAGQIFDALAARPGLGHGTLLSAARDTSPGRSVIWRRAPDRIG